MEKQTKGVGISICLGIAGFLVWLTIHEPTALVASIMGGIVAGIINSIIWSLTPDSNKEKKKESHKQVIITTLERTEYVQAVFQSDKTLVLMIPNNVNSYINTEKRSIKSDPDKFFPLEELHGWDRAKSHLKDKYDDVWNLFYSTHNKIEEYNNTHTTNTPEKLEASYSDIKKILDQFSECLHETVLKLKDGDELEGKCEVGY